MKKCLVASILILVVAARAESPTPTANVGGTPNRVNTNRGVTIFDDGVFNVEKGDDTPKTTKGTGGTERYVGEEPNYNSQQRQQWIELCEPKKKEDLKAFRDCFNAEKKKATETLRRKFDDVERKQSEPLRNQVPLMEERRKPSADETWEEKDD